VKEISRERAKEQVAVVEKKTRKRRIKTEAKEGIVA